MTKHAWGVAILAGLLVAAALIVIPRQTSFESTAEAACADRGGRFLGLVGSSGRYADPVPDGARCTSSDSMGFEEIDVDFFANGFLSVVYRLLCLLLPLGTGLLIGTRLSQRAVG